MKIGKVHLFTIILLAGITLNCAICMADRPVNATPEVQGIVTGTTMNVQGTTTETDALAWTTSSTSLHNPPLDFSLTGQETIQRDRDNNGLIITFNPISGDPTGEVRATTGYNEVTTAVSGQTSYSKSMGISTANKIADQSNVQASKNLQFIAIDTGRMTSTEDMLLDNAGEPTLASTSMLCPFASTGNGIIPAFCNIAQAGSSVDVSLVSMVTNTNERFVSSSADPGISLNYNINAQGIALGSTSSPAIGSASAFMKVHVQEARGATYTFPSLEEDGGEFITASGITSLKSEDLVYSESSSASGLISSFSKSMNYNSQVAGTGNYTTVIPLNLPPP